MAFGIAIAAVLALLATGCAAEDTETTEAAPAQDHVEEPDGAAVEPYMNPGAGMSVTQARATWSTG